MDDFDEASRTLSTAFERGTSYCAPFIGSLPITGAAISTIGAAREPETICASDEHAARIDELQFDLRQGPCWDAVRSQSPVLVPDLDRFDDSRWPDFLQGLEPLPVRSLFAFPLVVGSLTVGIIDMYSSVPVQLQPRQSDGAARLAGVAARQVLRELLATQTLDVEMADDVTREFSRRTVHQATGMVLAQLGISAADALVVLRAHAYASERSLSDVADDVINWRIDFSGDVPRSGEQR